MKVTKVVIKDINLKDLLTKIMEDFVESKEPEKYKDVDFFIDRIAKKRGWSLVRTQGWLNNIAEFNQAAAFSIVLREVAIWLDEKYEDHIENSEKIFAISVLDGRIYELNKSHIKNYRNFAAFRNIEDAKYACRVMRNQLKSMFKKHAEI